MLKKKGGEGADVQAQAFAEFNQQLFHDPNIPPDTYTPLANTQENHITPEELATTLTSHFKANRSSGLSVMPLQLLKFLGGRGVEGLAEFLNKSAIDQLAPASWRSTKVVPLYKG
jgi:hypothetical protein